jgi:hypothetical protein
MSVRHEVTLITANQGSRRDFTRISTSGFLPESVGMWSGGLEVQEGSATFHKKTHSRKTISK